MGDDELRTAQLRIHERKSHLGAPEAVPVYFDGTPTMIVGQLSYSEIPELTAPSIPKCPCACEAKGPSLRKWQATGKSHTLRTTLRKAAARAVST